MLERPERYACSEIDIPIRSENYKQVEVAAAEFDVVSGIIVMLLAPFITKSYSPPLFRDLMGN